MMSDFNGKEAYTNRSDAPADEKPCSSSKEPDASSGSNGGGWFSWYNEAKAKTLSTFDLVKKDLAEFGEIVGQQAVATLGAVVPPGVNQAPQALGAKAGQWVKNFAQTVNEAVIKMGDTTLGEEAETEIITVSGEKNSSFANGKLFVIQSDSGTFLNEPSGAPDLFEDWLDHFDVLHKKTEIRTLLNESAALKENFINLVPSKIKYDTFWVRYFYKIHQFELDQARLEAYVQKKTATSDRSSKESSGSRDSKRKSSSDSGDASWGDDSDLDELATIMVEKISINNENAAKTSAKLANLDEKTATAVLELEDLEQIKKDEKQDRPKNCSPSDVLSMSDSTEVVLTSEIGQEEGEAKLPTKHNVASIADEIGVKVSSADEELCSEKSFCIVNTSATSSINSDPPATR